MTMRAKRVMQAKLPRTQVNKYPDHLSRHFTRISLGTACPLQRANSLPTSFSNLHERNLILRRFAWPSCANLMVKRQSEALHQSDFPGGRRM
jgi:hypothetical protein